MTLTRFTLATSIFLFFSPDISSAAAPEVPKSAKRLNGQEIVALYDNIWFNFHNYMKPTTIGTFLVDFAAGTASGTFTSGKRHGNWWGTVRIRGDQFCRKIDHHREGCVYLLVHDGTIYEVNSDGVTESVNHRR